MSYDFDLLVLGAGSGGLAAAKRAASYGARVAIIEGGEVGGTCVVRGCVPKKFLVYASQFPQLIRDAVGYGWKGLTPPTLDWQKLRDSIQAEVKRLSALHVSLLERAGVILIRGDGSFEDPHTIAVGEPLNKKFTAERVIIATGGRPSLPNIEGVDYARSSDDMFHLAELPKRLVVAGGGYIGVEFASMMHGLGSDVTVVIRKKQILSGFDQEVRELLQSALEKRGISFATGKELKGLTKGATGVHLILEDDSAVEGDDVVLFATGRGPNVERLSLEKAGVTLRGRAVQVSEGNQTSQPHVFAIGDCTDRVNLTPVAIAEGRALADRIYGGKNSRVSYDLIPTAVFSTPEVGVVGMTEEQAKASYGEKGVVIYRTLFRPMYQALAGGEEKVFMKILEQRPSGKIVGVHIVGPSAAEMIQCVGIAIEAGATKEDFDRTMALHPSSAEELVTLYQPSS